MDLLHLLQSSPPTGEAVAGYGYWLGISPKVNLPLKSFYNPNKLFKNEMKHI